MLKGLSSGLQVERVCATFGKTTRHALTPERIAGFIREHLPEHFELDHGLYPGYELTLEDVSRAIGCSSKSDRGAVAARLEDPEADEEDFYWAGQEYCRKPSPFESEDHERWNAVGPWRHIAHELAHGRRFFNDTARSFFERLIGEALEAEEPQLPGIPAVVTARHRHGFDRGAPEAMVTPDWRPSFHLAIAREAVSMHAIEGVRCSHRSASIPVQTARP